MARRKVIGNGNMQSRHQPAAPFSLTARAKAIRVRADRAENG
jgi:hypothetical protein